MQVVISWLPQLRAGLELTLQLTVLSVLGSGLIGIIGGLSLLYGFTPWRQIVRLYVDVVRGIPTLVFLFAVYYVPAIVNVSLDAATAAVIALSFLAGAQVSEIVRGGIGSLPKAHLEAAKAIGLSSPQRFRLIVLPLAFPRMMPPWINTAVEILKGTSLVSLIGGTELLYATQSAVGTTFDPIPFYVFAACVYFVCSYGLSQLGGAVERRYAYREY